jgi:hypothetical protein
MQVHPGQESIVLAWSKEKRLEGRTFKALDFETNLPIRLESLV